MQLRILIAIFAALVMVVAAPLHAAHNHGDEATHLHAPCAVCQMHAPVGTPDVAPAVIVEPDGFGHLLPAPVLEFQPAICGDVHACRAPPILLAT